MFRVRWTRLAVVPIIAIAGASLWSTDASASTPTVKLSETIVKPGTSVAVIGAGFIPYQDASVSVCGDGGEFGSAGCDLNNQVTLQAGNNGSLNLELHVEIPPMPCPCAVVVNWGDHQILLPISIVGAPSSPLISPTRSGLPVLAVSGTQLTGTGPWTSWFGGPASRTLIFTLHNRGPGTLRNSAIVLSLHSWLGSTVAISAPNTGILRPGQSRTYHIPVNLGPFAIGQFKLNGEIDSFGTPATFEASTLSLPVGLVLVALVIIQMVLLAVRNVLRRRHERINRRELDNELDDPITAETEVVSAGA